MPLSDIPLAASPERRKVVSQVSLISRWHGRDDPRLPALRLQLKALAVEEIRLWAERAAQTLPALTQDEIRAIAIHVADITDRRWGRGGCAAKKAVSDT
jgi:hypothetical protein